MLCHCLPGISRSVIGISKAVPRLDSIKHQTLHIKHRLASLLLIPAMLLSARSDARKHDVLKEGDILFQFIPCGPLCDAIVATTPCAKDHPFNHCGIVLREGDSLVVLEAIGKNVHTTPLSKFTGRDTGRSLYVGRLKDAKNVELAANLKRAKALLGRPYDDIYLPGDTALYCSELVYESYFRNGKRVFQTEPMTFKSGDGSTYSGWADYYSDLGRDIPEGLPGTNPCGLSRDKAIRLMKMRKADLVR